MKTYQAITTKYIMTISEIKACRPLTEDTDMTYAEAKKIIHYLYRESESKTERRALWLAFEALVRQKARSEGDTTDDEGNG